ncbi:MAG: type II secretion system protein [Burkholderiales bacterium]|nr:type II secretion system protein [Burkholderiales bacterium]
MTQARIDSYKLGGCARGAGAALGFSLIELAMVMLIIALLLGSIMVPLTTQVEQRQVKDTQKMLEDIKEALIGHAVAKGYLPCPDRTSGGAGTANDTANDGVEDYGTPTAGECFGATAGNVPWVTLGLGASDPWGNRFRYRVDANIARRAPGSVFGLATAAGLVVCTTATCAVRLTPTTPDGAVAVILSHGKNGYGAMYALTNIARPAPTSADELHNLGGSTYGTRTPTAFASPCGGAGQPLCEFDDIVTWLGKYTLFNRMVAAGKLP